MTASIRVSVAGLIVALAAMPALAGPPYVTDDPEPTDTGHFENYFFVEDARAPGAFATPAVGFELNYGAFPNTQLTMSVPFNTNPGPGGMGIVWSPLGAGVKYEFIRETENGWWPSVAFFPSIAIPVGSASHSAPTTELFPIWMQKTFGAWIVFGGGGMTNNPGAGNRDFANYAAAVAYQVTPRLQLGAEVFGVSRSADNAGAATAVGLAEVFDFNENWHLVGSMNRGVINLELDRFSYNLAIKWTF